MNTARTLGTSAVIAALTLTMVGCNQAAEEAKTVTTVEKPRFANTRGVQRRRLDPRPSTR